MAKKINPEKQVAQWAEQLKTAFERWQNHQKYGCNDPAYPDGINMNLLLHHMLYFKQQIFNFCQEQQLELPPEYYLPIPPKVDPNYFANPHSPRAKNIVATWGSYYSDTQETGKNFNKNQLILF